MTCTVRVIIGMHVTHSQGYYRYRRTTISPSPPDVGEAVVYHPFLGTGM
jgi:hypothetical protein